MPLKRPTGEALAQALVAATGYAFRDFALMSQALTHSSARGKTDDNERLEFLGDRVLGLIVTDMLFKTFPDATQGELAVRLSALVSGAMCAEIADEIGLVGLIHADAGVKSQKGRKPKNVPADAVEALIAAIYLDGGVEAARQFVLRCWEPRARAVAKMQRDPKTELQEWAHQAASATPSYEIESKEGPDHEPVFTVAVRIAGYAPGAGSGRSKREAEQAAATAILLREGVWKNEGNEA